MSAKRKQPAAERTSQPQPSVEVLKTQLADDILRRIAKRYENCKVNIYPENPCLTPVEAVLRCAQEEGFVLTNAIQSQPQDAREALDERDDYRIMRLAGRCADGAERDTGTLWHAVPDNDWKAMCGTGPGKRSAGFFPAERLNAVVTCPKCLRKLAARAALKGAPPKEGKR